MSGLSRANSQETAGTKTLNDVRALIEERRARNLIRWHLAVAAVGAIFRIRQGFRVQKVSQFEVIVERNGRTRRFPIR